MGIFVTEDATNRSIATGGVIIPIAIPTVNISPKCMRLTPSILINGRNTGVRSIIAEDVSMNTPAMSIRTDISMSITYLFVETKHRMQLPHSSLPEPIETPLHAIIIIMIAEVFRFQHYFAYSQESNRDI